MFMNIPSTFSVFPVSGKTPLVQWGEFSKRKHTYDERKEWDWKFGTNWQKGIATGPVSGILVLDDDGGLDETVYPVPKTWSAKTPRGGTHYYFKWLACLDNKVTTKTEILPKVDIRGQGGFVVHYGFHRPYMYEPLASPPQWLIDLLPNKGPKSPIVRYANPHADCIQHEDDHICVGQDEGFPVQAEQKSHIQGLLDNVHIGNRNDSFTRIAGSLRARGYSSGELFDLLISRAREVEFPEGELKTICDSVSRYTPNIQTDESQAQNIDEFLKDQEKVEWICEGLIAKKSIGFVVGLPESGKTWMMIDLAIECAKGGGKWLGKFPVEKAKVLFIDQERFRGETQRRFKSVIGAMNLRVQDCIQGLFIKSGTTIRLNLQNSFDAFRKELGDLKPDLVIIDSFAAFHTSEENNRKDIQAVLERVKELRNEFGCTFLFIHHESKMAFDKEQGEPSIAQMAGSIAIPAAAETVLTVRKHDSESSMVYQTKSTLASTHEPFLIKIVDMNPEKTKIKVEAY